MYTHNINIAIGKDFVNQPVLFRDTPAPTSLQLVLQGFRFAQTLKGVFMDISNQFKYFFTNLSSVLVRSSISFNAMGSKMVLVMVHSG